MSFLRRLFATEGTAEPDDVADPAELEAEERSHELELLRAEQDRLDPLRQRQLRYADRAWTPPSQGGDRRADDADADVEDGRERGG